MPSRKLTPTIFSFVITKQVPYDGIGNCNFFSILKNTQCSKTIVQVRSYAAPKCFTNPCASNTNEGEIKPRCRWAAIRSASCCNQPFLSASLLTENPTDFLGGPASAERKERNMHMSFGLRTSHLCKLLVYLLLQRAVGSLM